MNGLMLTAVLLLAAAALWYGGRALLRGPRRGQSSRFVVLLGEHPKAAAALVIVPIALLFGFGVSALLFVGTGG